MLVLFQFFAVHIVLGFYESSAPQELAISPPSVQVKKPQPPKPSQIGLPLRIKIPRIQVNAAIRYVGLLPDGSMGVPELPRDTAWYMLGPKPGEIGSAVIAGHLDWWYGATGVFKSLKTLRVGDIIRVQDEHGMLISFVVRKTHLYGNTEDASDVFRSSDGKSHLNLVTCSGAWDKKTKIYEKRLVVFADRVE